MLNQRQLRAPTLGVLAGVWGALLLCIACNESSPTPQSSGEQSSSAQVTELKEAFLVRAVAAMDNRLGPETRVLEIRATGDTFSIHLQTDKNLPASEEAKAIPAGSLVQLDYVEQPGTEGQPPIGKIHGPVRIEVHGKGEVKDNLFPFSEVNLPAIGRAFKIGTLAIDPKDGKVEKLVVRRNLPFGKRVRGRIFVHSPRMSGTIDVNEKGTPLKR